MRSNRWGVRFSEEGKPVSDPKNLVYDSELNQLKVNRVAIPPHLYKFNELQRATNLSVTAAGKITSEVLFKFRHNLPFKPSVWAYFNVVDAPSGAAIFIDRYLIDFVRLGATIIYADADEEYVYIKHDVYYVAFPGAPDPETETNADQFKLRVKIMGLNGRFAGQIAQVV